MGKRRNGTNGKGDTIRQGVNWKKYTDGYKRVFGDRTPVYERTSICSKCKGLGCNRCDDGMVYVEGRIT